jgi:hypothetical protein
VLLFSPLTNSTHYLHYLILGFSFFIFSFQSIIFPQAFEAEMLQQIGLGSVAKVRALLASGMSPNSVDDATGNSLLHWAAIFGQSELVQLFLSERASITAKNLSGKTALECSASPAVKAAFEAFAETLRCKLETSKQQQLNGKGMQQDDDVNAGISATPGTPSKAGLIAGEDDEVTRLRQQVQRLQMVAEERLHTMQTLRESLNLILEERGVMRLVSKLQAENATLEAELAQSTELVSHLRAQLKFVTSSHQVEVAAAAENARAAENSRLQLVQQERARTAETANLEHPASPGERLLLNHSQDFDFTTARERELFEQVQSLKMRVQTLETQVGKTNLHASHSVFTSRTEFLKFFLSPY